ncbi:MAG: hypothetical protein LBL69_05960 [Zoogloeaceae bacterium]|jgi:hypothetical protein|nr:hypothetical protein [Zoogloeaceae bacterium]
MALEKLMAALAVAALALPGCKTMEQAMQDFSGAMQTAAGGAGMSAPLGGQVAADCGTAAEFAKKFSQYDKGEKGEWNWCRVTGTVTALKSVHMDTLYDYGGIILNSGIFCIQGGGDGPYSDSRDRNAYPDGQFPSWPQIERTSDMKDNGQVKKGQKITVVGEVARTSPSVRNRQKGLRYCYIEQ